MIKTVELPVSGEKVDITKPGIVTLHRIFKALPSLATMGDEDTRMGPADQMEMAIRVVTECTGYDEDGIEELDPADAMFLAGEVMELVNLDGRAEKLRPLSQTKTA